MIPSGIKLGLYFSEPFGARQLRYESMTEKTSADCSVSFHRTLFAINPDLAINEILATILIPAGWRIQNAPDNMAALELTGSRPFDLIVTGEKTSGREDLELPLKIRRARPHTRMIILTDTGKPEDVIACMRERAFSYFSKPISLDSLAEVVRMAVEGP